MSLESDLKEFRDLYHQYEDACDELRSKEQIYKSVSSMGNKEFFSTTQDSVVRLTVELDGKAQAARARAQAQVDTASERLEKVSADYNRMVDAALSKRANYQTSLTQAATKAAESLDRLKAQGSSPRKEARRTANLTGRQIAAIATAVVCVGCVFGSGTLGLSDEGVSDVSGWILVLGMAAGLVLGFLLCENHAILGCLAGIGLALGEIFVAAFVAATGGILSLSIFVAFLACCVLAYWLIKVLGEREDMKLERTHLDWKVKDAEAALAKAEEEKSANWGRYDSEVDRARSAAEEARKPASKALEVAQGNLDAAKHVYSEEVVPLLKAAHARSNALLALNVEKTSRELAEAYDGAEQLHDELDAMVEGDEAKSLPEEEDWPAIDALYDAVRRGYAESRKEALLFCRQESRYRELMGSLDRQYEEAKSLRESVSSQLASLEAQGDRRDAVLAGQLDVMRTQLSVARASLSSQAVISGQVGSLIGQGERAAAQRSQMLSQGREVAATQHEIAGLAKEQNRQLAEVSAKVDKVTKAVKSNTAVGGLGVLVSDSTRRNVKAIGKTLGL